MSRYSLLKPRYEKIGKSDYTIALAGNPNTGKSTIFNTLTGLKQHTGNWPGKTVGRAQGAFDYHDQSYDIVDLPGTYSLLSTSEDEEIARDFILFGKPDATLIVADATRLERNLNLVLQILAITDRAVLCINLMDEADRNGIRVDLVKLSQLLGIPVVGTSAGSGKGIDELLHAMEACVQGKLSSGIQQVAELPVDAEVIISSIQNKVEALNPETPNSRWITLRIIEGDKQVQEQYADDDLVKQADEANRQLGERFHDRLSESIYARVGEIYAATVHHIGSKSGSRDRRIDRIVTSKIWGFPLMVALLSIVLWLTIIGSNYPSGWLSEILVKTIHPWLHEGALQAGMDRWLVGLLVDGVYLATAWVVSVMLPPMAIFFPLFTLLEDFGYLPRVAFNLDGIFRRCGAHGKQALTMSMGFGCNAAGVVATRIIDSPRERLIAIITNNFSLCNGRWPTQIMMASIFLGALVPTALSGIVSVTAVMVMALLGIGFMFLSSWILSRTVLRGEVSTFHLELPPYRPPHFWQTIYTSLIDRTLIVLWRAVVFAAPAGAVIWLTCNINIADMSIAEHLISILNYPGLIMGLNGIILLAYILGIPANEIVIPTILMLTILVMGKPESGGVLIDTDDAGYTARMLHQAGWSTLTGVNLMLFSLLHNPCSTTIYTIYKETHSIRWTAVATLMPLMMGIILTTAVAFVWRLF